MQIVLLDETRFDNYAINHPNYNFYQSSNYGKFMTKNAYNTYYLGLVDDLGDIKAATLILVKNDRNNRRKMGYAPRGFLIDWNDDKLVATFTEAIKDYLSKRGFTYIKLDPPIIYKEHNMDGSEKQTGQSNLTFVKKLQALGYIHMGFNNGQETTKPRWNATIKLDKDITALFNSISKEARDKIKHSASLGNTVYKGSSEDIPLLYSTINKASPPIEYYLDFYQFFNQINGFEIYFTKLEPIKFVNSSQELYAKEEIKNNELNLQIQDWTKTNKEQIINKKLKSDEILAKYKKEMVDATKLFQEFPNGIVIAAIAVIKYGKTISFLSSGINERFKDHNPEYLLKWQLIQEYANQGYNIVEYNGMLGDFKDDYDSVLKRELSNNIIEYVGEFDLVINKKLYYTGNKLNPILTWLNTPI